MSLLFVDGFDHWDQSDGLTCKWDAYSSTNLYVGTTYARWSDMTNAQGMSTYSSYYIEKLVGNQSTLVVGISFLKNETNAPTLSTSAPLIAFYDNADRQIGIHIDANYAINAYRNTTYLGKSADNVLQSQKWFHLQVKVVFDQSAGSVEVKVNGTTVLNLTGIDTCYSANAYANAVRIGGVYSGMHGYWDDLWIDDSDFLGELRVKTYWPDSDETHTDFTPNTGTDHYAVVDNLEITDDANYNESDTNGHKDSYGWTVDAFGTVQAVAVNMAALQSDATTRTVRCICRSNGTDYNGDSEDTDTAVNVHQHVWATDPDDSNAWTQAKIQAAEFGIEIVS
jgi:hypothetical protein